MSCRLRTDLNEVIEMKVLLVEQLGAKDYEYTYGAAKHFSSDFSVTVYTSDDTPKDVKAECFQVEYGFKNVYKGSKIKKGIRYVNSLFQLKSYIKKNRFDIVHFQWYEIPLFEKLIFRSIKRLYKPRPRIVMTVHGIEPKEQGWYRHFGLQQMYLEADAICLHSDQAINYFNQCYSTSCPKYMITPALFDENDYMHVEKQEARRTLGIPEDKTVLLSFGTVRDDKTIDLLLEAFPKAFERNKELYLLSGGTLSATDKDRYLRLAEECNKTGSARIDFKYIDKSDEPLYYSAADILVLPYRYISQSGVAYCGLVYDLAMIASDIPRLDLMAKSGVNAAVFGKGDVEDLVEKIVKLSKDKEKIEEYSLGSRHIREKEFSIKRRVSITEEVYKSLVN